MTKKDKEDEEGGERDEQRKEQDLSVTNVEIVLGIMH